MLSSADGPARGPADAGRAIVAAAATPVSLALVVVVVLCLVTVEWLAAAAVPVWLLVVAAGAADRLRTPGVAPAATPPALPSGLPAGLLEPARRALEVRGAVLRELDALPAEPTSLRAQVVRLGDELTATLQRAAAVDDYLAGVDVEALRRREAACRDDPSRRDVAAALAEQVRAVEDLAALRRGLASDVEEVEAGLGAVRARLVQVRAGAAVPHGLTDEVRLLRDQVRAVADGFAEAYGHNDPHGNETEGRR